MGRVRGEASSMVELLAPAGTPDAFRAAIAAGADAVYVGLGSFNARAANGGFSLSELSRGCALAHAHGSRVYVTLNACMHDDELASALELASAALDAGADALIVADVGLCDLIHRELPGVELHLSTQTGAQSVGAVRLAVRELGVSRVTCARELSLAELAGLCAGGTPIEAFCHGAICICYSGACSYSALMRGRSANRGDCTQPCRLAYALEDDGGRLLAGGAWERDVSEARGAGRSAAQGDRLLCPRDYLGIRHVSALVGAGVASLKIEGRMKGPDYVYNVVGCYREALDAALAGVELDECELDELEARLARSFNRGFTDGYLRGGHTATGAGLVSVERAINQGLEVGIVDEPGYEGAWVRFTREVAAGDMLEICSTPGANAPADVPKRWPIVPCPANVGAQDRAFVRCKRKVEVGSAVHLVRSAALVAASRAAVDIVRDEELSLGSALTEPCEGDGRLDDGGRFAHARRKSPHLSPAERRPVRESELSRHDCAQMNDFAHRELTLGAAGGAEGARAAGGAAEGTGDAVREAGELDGVIDLGEVCRAGDIPFVVEACAAVARGEADALLCRNIGQVDAACEAAVAWEVAPPLNVWNAQTARVLQGLGARRIWLPEELSDENVVGVQNAARLAGVSVPVARVASGSTPLMVMEHCVLTAEGPCDGACATCSRRLASERGDRFLVELDRNASDARLAVRVDERGRTRLYR